MRRSSERNSKIASKPKSSKKFDYNKPISRCSVCYTLSGWHCYDCENDYCESHFHIHKETNQCMLARQ